VAENWVSKSGGLPDYIDRIRKHLEAEGMSTGHAIATAVNAARKMAADPADQSNWPGKQHVNPGSRAEAAAAVAQWEAMKAAHSATPSKSKPAASTTGAKSTKPAAPVAAAKEVAVKAKPVAQATQGVQAAAPSARRFDDSALARHGLTVTAPDGTVDRAKVHAAAAKLPTINASMSELRAPALALVKAYKELGESPPPAVTKLAGAAAAVTVAGALTGHGDSGTKTEARAATGEVETRSAPDVLTVEGRRLRGVIPYGVESRDLGGFTEVMAPGCLRNADLGDLVATVDHAGLPIGRYPSTIALEDREDGLHWSVELPESRADVREAVERGDLAASSWRMVVARDRWDGNRRTVEEVRSLRDVAVVTTSAYPASYARAELRSQPETEPTEEEIMEDEDVDGVEVDAVDEAPIGGGTLTVEDRSLPPEDASIETRVLDAMRGVPSGESRDLTTADISAGPVTPPELSTYLWDQMRDRAVVLASGIRVITTDQRTIQWPALISDADASFYDELDPIDESDPGFTEHEVRPKKIAALVRGSSEAFDDSSPDLLTIVQDNLQTILALKLDRALLAGSLATDPKGFNGMLNVAGIQVLDADDAMTNYDVFARAVGMLAGAHVPGPYYAIGHSFTATALSLLKTTIGDTLARPEGVPALAVTSAIGRDATAGTSSAVVFAPAAVCVVRRQEVEMLTDRSAEFTTDAVLVRAKLRACLFTPYPKAIVHIENLPAPDPSV
jgi:HK97 family phage major capsid protein